MFVRRLQQQLIGEERPNETQLKLGLPGLAREVSEICNTIKIPDVNFNNVDKEKIQEFIFIITIVT